MSLSKYQWIVVNDDDDIVVVEAETISEVVEMDGVSEQPLAILKSKFS